MADTANRRPIKSRSSGWAHGLAALAARAGATPDLISASSVVFGAIGGGLLLAAGRVADDRVRGALLVGAAAMVQLRLVANLIDGMVAVEHHRGSSAGPIWNELPDRFTDVMFLAGAGYCAAMNGAPYAVEAGWLASAFALLTAYLRELGRGMGFPADFSGPFAKQQRMGALTAALVLAALEPLWGWRGQTLDFALALIATGTALTAARRTFHLARHLAERAQAGDS